MDWLTREISACAIRVSEMRGAIGVANAMAVTSIHGATSMESGLAEMPTPKAQAWRCLRQLKG